MATSMVTLKTPPVAVAEAESGDDDDGDDLLASLSRCSSELEVLWRQLEPEQQDETNVLDRDGVDDDDDEDAQQSTSALVDDCMSMLTMLEDTNWVSVRSPEAPPPQKEPPEVPEVDLTTQQSTEVAPPPTITNTTDKADSPRKAQLLLELNDLGKELEELTLLLANQPPRTPKNSDPTPPSSPRSIATTCKSPNSHSISSPPRAVDASRRPSEPDTSTTTVPSPRSPPLASSSAPVPPPASVRRSSVTTESSSTPSMPERGFYRKLFGLSRGPTPTAGTKRRKRTSAENKSLHIWIPPYPVKSSSSSRSSNNRSNSHPLKRTSRGLDLDDPIIWKQYQSKSFQQHIQRQEEARHQQAVQRALEKRVVALRYKQVTQQQRYPLRSSCGPLSPRMPDSLYRTYLSRFYRARAQTQAPTSPTSPRLSTGGKVVGVYLFGERSGRMIYMTCSSLQDLKDRAAKKFALPSLQNVYRERQLRHRDVRLQRVTRYEQLQEGDCVCITRTAYEDMGVLCDWIKQRQQQSSTSEVALRRDSPISCSPKPSNSSLAQASPKRRPKAKANTTDGDGSPEAPRAVSLDLRKLWDANGRVVAIDPQVELRRLRHVRSSIAEGWLFEQLQ